MNVIQDMSRKLSPLAAPPLRFGVFWGTWLPGSLRGAAPSELK